MARPKREVPWIAKRGGVYYAFWHREGEAETQRLSLRTRDSSEAKNRFAQFLSEGSLAEPRGNAGITVRQILDDYYREHASKKCADPRRQEDAIVHLKAFFGDTPLDRVGIPQSRAYADARRAGVIGGGQRHFDERRKGSDSTIRRELVVLHAASKHAEKWKRTTAVLHLDLPAEKRLGEDEQAPYYTREEFTRLVGKADGELRQFITLAYYTGARRRSIEDLTIPQIRWDQRQIVLKAATKRSTKKRQPIVPIFDEMVEPLETLALDAVSRGDGRLFETADFYRPFRQLCEGAGLADRSHPHLLRHTRATHLLQAGVPIYDVAKLLGDTLVTVDRVYGHHSSERLFESLRGK